MAGGLLFTLDTRENNYGNIIVFQKRFVKESSVKLVCRQVKKNFKLIFRNAKLKQARST